MCSPLELLELQLPLTDAIFSNDIPHARFPGNLLPRMIQLA